jgi:methylmalonyl-CoA mutase
LFVFVLRLYLAELNHFAAAWRNCTFDALKKPAIMPKKLFSEFEPSTYSQWQEKTQRDLKGKPFEDLFNLTSDNILVYPLYVEQTLKNEISPQPISDYRGWVVFEEILVNIEKEANKKALDYLNRGANGLLFYVVEDTNIAALLKDVLMEHVTLHFVVDGSGLEILNQWMKVAEERNIDPNKLSGTINIDPIENAARTGNWREGEQDDLTELEELVEACPPSIKAICINNSLFGNAGATPAQQLGLALAHTHEYLLRIGTKHASQFWVNMSIGRRYFREIAKFRAMRRLWRFMLSHYDEGATPLTLFTESGIRNKTIYDPWVNMLRTTTEGMSAAIGGCDEMLLRGYDAYYREGSDLGDRAARNQQLILAYESYFSQVKDAAAGSYYTEELTEELAKKGWEVFKNIEAMGGLIEALKSGYVQDIIEQAHQHEQELFNEGRLNLLGANLFPNREERMASEVSNPLYAMPIEEPVEIRPVVPRRLAEELEKERLAAEAGKE